jgi:hypothetical protein
MLYHGLVCCHYYYDDDVGYIKPYSLYTVRYRALPNQINLQNAHGCHDFCSYLLEDKFLKQLMPQKYPIMFPVCIDVSLIPDRIDFCSSTTLIELLDFSIHLLELAELRPMG